MPAHDMLRKRMQRVLMTTEHTLPCVHYRHTRSQKLCQLFGVLHALQSRKKQFPLLFFVRAIFLPASPPPDKRPHLTEKTPGLHEADTGVFATMKPAYWLNFAGHIQALPGQAIDVQILHEGVGIKLLHVPHAGWFLGVFGWMRE